MRITGSTYLLVERADTLETCLDKVQLMAHCAHEVRVPLTILLDGSLSPQQFLSVGQPFAVEARYFNASRVRLLITDPAQLNDFPCDGSLIASRIVRGSDFAIDVLSRSDGHVVVSIPQALKRTVDGRVVPARIVADRDLQEFARRVAVGVGATHVISVMVRRQDDGSIILMDVIPRFAATVRKSIATGVNLPVLAAADVLGATLPNNLDFWEEDASYGFSASSTTPADARVGSTVARSAGALVEVG